MLMGERTIVELFRCAIWLRRPLIELSELANKAVLNEDEAHASIEGAGVPGLGYFIRKLRRYSQKADISLTRSLTVYAETLTFSSNPQPQ